MIRWFHQQRQSLGLALQLLTLIPIHFQHWPGAKAQGRAPLYYPAVGLLIGVLLALTSLLPFDPQVSAALVLAVWAAVTGGLHLDGLADSADGWMAGHGDPDRTLRVMKDPHIGAIGVIVLVITLLLKWAALTALLAMSNPLLLLLAPLLARTGAVTLMLTTAYASPNGMARAMMQHLPRAALIYQTALIGLLLLPLLPLVGIAVLLVFWLARRAMLARLGGMTGDTIGALIELLEVAILLALVAA